MEAESLQLVAEERARGEERAAIGRVCGIRICELHAVDKQAQLSSVKLPPHPRANALPRSQARKLFAPGRRCDAQLSRHASRCSLHQRDIEPRA